MTDEDSIARITRRVVLPGTIGTIEATVRIELTPEQLASIRARLDEAVVYEIEPRSDDDH